MALGPLEYLVVGFEGNHFTGVLMTVKRRLPGARLLASYRISWLRRDMVTGIVLSTLLVL